MSRDWNSCRFRAEQAGLRRTKPKFLSDRRQGRAEQGEIGRVEHDAKESENEEILATTGLIGAFLGALFWGTLSDYIGRRTSFQATVGIFAVFTGLTHRRQQCEAASSSRSP